jgi:hypothetical protein
MIIAPSGSNHGSSSVSTLLKLVGLSAAMEGDATISRQAQPPQRKFLESI